MPRSASANNSGALTQKQLLWGTLLAIALAIGLTLPSLTFGWFGDDFAHRRFILDHLQGAPSRVAFWNMFDWRELADRDRVDAGSLFGRLPWWAAPDFSFALLRPLSTLSHFVDYWLWPEQPWLMHLHNVALYAVIVALAGVLYRELFGASYWALLATCLFAIDDAHIVSVAWIASRNTLLTAAWVLATVWFYIRSTGQGSIPSWLTSVSLLCAHASSEGAIVVWAYLGAYVLLVDQRAASAKLRSLLPLFVVSMSWMTGSALLGYGVRGSQVYVDPRYAPGLFAELFPARFFELLRSQFSVWPDLAQRWPNAWGATASWGCALYGSIVALSVALLARGSVALRFFALASVAALIPQCAAGSFARLLLLSGFGAHGVLAALAASLFRGPRQRASFVAYALATFLVHVCLALDTPRHALAFSRMVHGSVLTAAASLPRAAANSGTDMVVLNFPDYLRSVFVDLYRRELFMPGPSRMDVVGIAPGRVHLKRSSVDSIELDSADGFLMEPSTLLVRTSSDRFAVGQGFAVSRLTLEILRITADGRPAALRLSGQHIADASALWLRWDLEAQRFVRIRLPDADMETWLESREYDLP